MANSIAPPAIVGFIGLGNMGAPMARRLAAAGYRLIVADASADARARFASGTPCVQATDLVGLGEQCRAVITMLPDGRAVREVLLGERGVAAGLQPGAVLIDMSSASPVGTRALAAELAARGFPLVDAPVSGGVKKAADGTLAIMAGGEAEVIARLRPLLELMGRLFPTGPTGSGHAMKALNNYLSAAAVALTGEAVIAGTRFGLDPQTMIDILNASTGRNTATEQKFPACILPRTFDSGFHLGLMAKDLRLALELAESTGAPHQLLSDLSAMYDRAEQQLGFQADNTEIVRYLESLVVAPR